MNSRNIMNSHQYVVAADEGGEAEVGGVEDKGEEKLDHHVVCTMGGGIGEGKVKDCEDENVQEEERSRDHCVPSVKLVNNIHPSEVRSEAHELITNVGEAASLVILPHMISICVVGRSQPWNPCEEKKIFGGLRARHCRLDSFCEIFSFMKRWREAECKRVHDPFYAGDGRKMEVNPVETDGKCIWVPGPIIVGGGPSGLAVAACFKKKGIPCVVLERANCVASLWQLKAYDRLHLHLPKEFCELPLMPF
ncbi:hypothetical protein GW17_00032270, partial [Ensete ventricosum]